MADIFGFASRWFHWLTLDANFLTLETRYWVGFLVSLGCFLIVSLWFVREISGKAGDPHLFTVLALFAGVWALTASIYEIPDGANPYEKKNPATFRPHDVAGDLASFLMVFVGALLAREGTEPNRYVNSKRLQVLALILLGSLMVPTQAAPRLKLSPSNAEMIEVAVSCALGLVGFISIAVGSRAISAVTAPRQHRWLLVVLVCYALLVIIRNAQVALLPVRMPMSDVMVFCFALAKLLLTLMFGYIVVTYHEHRTTPAAKPQSN